MMRAFLRLFPYVRKLETDLAVTQANLDQERRVMVSMNRYIDQLEELKHYTQERIAELERRTGGGRR